jgi:hypothetical protein
VRQEIRKQLKKERQVKKPQLPPTPRNLSVHVDIPSDAESTSNPAIPVMNHDLNAEILMGNCSFLIACVHL